MNELLQANIFFFITALAVTLVTIVLLALLFYVLYIVKDIRKISKRASQEFDAIANDIDSAREGIKDEHKKILSLWTVFSSMFAPKKKIRKKKK